MTVSMIAAIGKNNELGRGNNLIWRFSQDMKFFKAVTMGNTVVMGRKTFESLPHALPGRRNIVITSNNSFKAEGAEICKSPDEVMKLCAGDNVFIIGGASVYKHFLPFAEKLYLTEINDCCSDADVYFPKFNRELYSSEKIASYSDGGTDFSHIIYTKK